MVGRKALQDFKNCPIRFYIVIDMALNMKWVVKVGDKYYPNPTNLNFCLPSENSTKRYNAILRFYCHAINTAQKNTIEIQFVQISGLCGPQFLS